MSDDQRSLTFSNLNPDPQVETSLLVDAEAVYNEIAAYLNTSKRERLFRLGDGGDPKQYLFELAESDENGAIGAFELYSRIMTEIPSAMPRVDLIPEKSSVIADVDNYRMVVRLAFTIKGLGDTEFEFGGYLLLKS